MAAAAARDKLIAAIASTSDERDRTLYSLFLAMYDDLGRRLDELHEDQQHRADHDLLAEIRREREQADQDARDDKRAARDQFIRSAIGAALAMAAGAVGMAQFLK